MITFFMAWLACRIAKIPVTVGVIALKMQNCSDPAKRSLSSYNKKQKSCFYVAVWKGFEISMFYSACKLWTKKKIFFFFYRVSQIWN